MFLIDICFDSFFLAVSNGESCYFILLDFCVFCYRHFFKKRELMSNRSTIGNIGMLNKKIPFLIKKIRKELIYKMIHVK